MSRITIKEKDTLYSLLKRNSFSDTEINKLLALKPLPLKYKPIPSEPYLVVSQPGDKRHGIKLFEQLSDTSYYLWKKPSGEVGSESILESFRKEVTTIRGKIVGGILTSIRSIIDSTWIAYRFLDAYIFDINPKKDISRGAQFSMKIEKKFLNDQFIKYGEILETDLEVRGQSSPRKFHSFSDGGVFLQTPYLAEATKPLYAPVNYLRVTSTFQMRRFHPVRQKRVAHLGVDFELPIGSEVYASYGGQVEKIGSNRASGNFVVVRHPNGYETSYHHLSTFAPKLYEGRRLNAGDYIGAVGCTGYCTSPHLHFTVKKYGRPIDPFLVTKRYPYQFAQQLFEMAGK